MVCLKLDQSVKFWSCQLRNML